MNILEIIVIVLAAGFALGGYHKGFIRKLASIVSLVLSIALVSAILPYVTDFLKNNTPVYSYITQQCENMLEEQLTDTVLSGTGADSYMDLTRDEIKELLAQYGYDSSVVDTLTDEQLESYKEQYIEQYVSQYVTGDASQEPSKIEQTEIIESLPIPEVLRDLLLDHNNDEGYRSLSVTTFRDYIVEFFATAILNVLAFLAAALIVGVLLRVVIAALNILAHVPVISTVNRLLGLGLGLAEALFFLWLFFLILSMATATEIGLQLLSMVQESAFLSYLYESNLFMQIVLQASAFFL